MVENVFITQIEVFGSGINYQKVYGQPLGSYFVRTLFMWESNRSLSNEDTFIPSIITTGNPS